MKFLKGLGVFGSLIISVMIVLVGVAMTLYLSIDNLFSINTVKSLFNTETLYNLEIGELIDYKDPDATIEDVMVNYFVEGGIKESDARDIVTSETCQKIINKYLDDAVNYYLDDGSKPVIADDDWNELVDMAVSKYSGKASVKKKISDELKPFKTEFENMLPSKENIVKDSEFDEILTIYNSISIFYFIGAIVLLMFIIMLFTWSLYRPFKYAGISLILSSLPFIVLGFLKTTINQLILSLDDAFVSIVALLLDKVCSGVLVSGLIVLGVGVFMIVCYIIISKLRNKNVESN